MIFPYAISVISKEQSQRQQRAKRPKQGDHQLRSPPIRRHVSLSDVVRSVDDACHDTACKFASEDEESTEDNRRIRVCGTRRNIQGMIPMAGIAESTAISANGKCVWTPAARPNPTKMATLTKMAEVTASVLPRHEAGDSGRPQERRNSVTNQALMTPR
jgi:hypothetical protein